MTRPRVQTTPGQRHGVASDSDQEARTPLGSESIAAFNARSESPSEFRASEKEPKKKKKKKKKKIVINEEAIGV